MVQALMAAHSGAGRDADQLGWGQSLSWSSRGRVTTCAGLAPFLHAGWGVCFHLVALTSESLSRVDPSQPPWLGTWTRQFVWEPLLLLLCWGLWIPQPTPMGAPAQPLFSSLLLLLVGAGSL